jgi:hypothetical protein
VEVDAVAAGGDRRGAADAMQDTTGHGRVIASR